MLNIATSTALHFPTLYFPVAMGLAALLVETWFKRRQPWAIPSATLYVTIFAWYFADLFITPEEYDFIPQTVLNIAYGQVAAFLIIYRLLLPWLTRKFVGNVRTTQQPKITFPPESLFVATIVLWVILLIFGVAMLHGDLVGALFPLDARTGELMWERGAAGDAGASGFLVSTGGYLYLLVCASFGVWLILIRSVTMRWVATGLILVSWPFFLLSGTRSNFLAVCVPFFLAYSLFGRQKMWIRVVSVAAAFSLVNFSLLLVITYRNIGFSNLFASQSSYDSPDELASHQGLNMIQELCFTNIYSQTHPPEDGARYLVELTNVVPRALWPSKPLLGIDYAAWRGFEGGDNDIGVVATISSGMIGGGVLNFGLWFGPVAPAVLIALWGALLARWWVQRTSLLRCLLFLIGLGLTFNLGRDITLLVLWPIVFGYLIVRITERIAASKLRLKRGVVRSHVAPTASRQTLRRSGHPFS